MKRTSALIMAALMAITATAAQHVQPAFWWAGMKNSVVQVLLHDKNIGTCDVTLDGATGVAIDHVVRPANANYLLVYLNTGGAAAQQFNFVLTPHDANGKAQPRRRLKIPYELREREGRYRHAERYASTGLLSWDADDVLYLLMPDRWRKGETKPAAKGKAKKGGTAAMREPAETFADNPMARWGGNIAGITESLDYLADLGITAIWPTPVQVNDMPKESYHGYAITDYYQIDPRMGTNEDFRHMVDEAHKRGIKVIMDLVFNHCGRYNFLFQDMPDTTWFNHGAEYTQTNYKTGATGDPHASATDRDLAVNGWFVASMPDLNQQNPDVMTYLIQAAIWWTEYAGIDGIRQDTYPYADMEQMGRWCDAMQAEYPGYNIVGETWVNHPVGIAYWQKGSRLAAADRSPAHPEGRDSRLPSVMDFPLMSIINQAVDEETNEWDRGLARVYELLGQDAVYEDTQHLLTFLDNHDTDRFAKDEDQARNVARYRQALTLLLTLRGTPQLYYGDEIAMAANKAKGDGVLRQPMQTLDSAEMLPYQVETHDFARRLLQWRKTCPALWTGRLTHFAVRGTVYVYARQAEGRTVTVIMNGSDRPATVATETYREVLPGSEAYDVISSKTVKPGREIELPARGIMILDFK